MRQQSRRNAAKYTPCARWHDLNVTSPRHADGDRAAAGPSTEALVAGCRQGRADAWSQLVRRFQRLVYAVPRRAGLDEATAGDVLQLVFQRLVEHIDRIDDASRLQAWLVTTAKRETLRVLALRQRQAAQETVVIGVDPDGDADSVLDTVADPTPLQDEQLATVQAHARLRAAVDRLDPRSRLLVELLFLTDPPPAYAEVAQRLGVPEGSIGPTRARCLAKLRKLLPDV
jgi:RNA polymerase sigma factor (sigma-70 family)